MLGDKEVGQLKGGQPDIEWEIGNFLSLSKRVDVFYRSPVFFFGGTSWYIGMYPNGQKYDSSEGWIGLYVCKGNSGPPVTAIYSLFLKKKDGREEICSEYEDTFEGKDDSWGEPEAIERSQLIDRKDEYLPSGFLTVVCTLKLDDEREVKANKSTEAYTQTEADFCTEKTEARTQIEARYSTQSSEACTQTEADSCTDRSEAFNQAEAYSDFDRKTLAAAVQDTKVLRDFKKLCLSGENCDVTLQVSGQPFEAHRCILAARSPVFASMLSHDMKEKNTGQIDIVDCDQDTFADFLRFLYCGNVEIITSQNACSLYRAADKYNVDDLKSECLAYIKSHLDVDNFCDVITLALRHREFDLVNQATEFFAKNILDVIVTVKWQVFVTENPIESNELTIKALSANKRSNT